MKTLIIGTGNLGHVLAGVISNNGYDVGVLSRSPEKWSKEILVTDSTNKEFKGEVEVITSIEKQVPNYQHIILCVPGNVIEEIFYKIRDYLHPKVKIGIVFGSTGFFWIANKILGNNVNLYAFERVPYMSKIINYGSTAKITGYKTQHKIFFHMNDDDKKLLIDFYQDILGIPVMEMNHYLDVSLSNSNPLLHTARLYGLLKNYTEETFFDNEILFYKGWTMDDSKLLVNMDIELGQILKNIGITSNNYKSSLDHYDSTNYEELTDKINSIPAFQEVKLPMIKSVGGLKPNLNHRFFEEDIPYGLVIIKSISLLINIETPYIDMVLNHFQEMMKKTYIIENNKGPEYEKSAGVQNFGIENPADLIGYLV
jgi:opine dehydrogenase